jgi:hypothetical protein
MHKITGEIIEAYDFTTWLAYCVAAKLLKKKVNYNRAAISIERLHKDYEFIGYLD